MTHDEKIQWMAMWAVKNNVQLTLQGECGFGRPCVGILVDGTYPDYEWYDKEYYERIDENGDIWIPPDAYHKHPCVAVLGRGEQAESQLYDWLNWFDNNGFEIETGEQDVDTNLVPLAYILGHHRYARMVRQKEDIVQIGNNVVEDCVHGLIEQVTKTRNG